MSHFGLGHPFLAWVDTIYHLPSAAVLTNGLISSQFPLGQGTRQGCPLSPLLFVLILEPLAEAIRSEPAIKSICVGGRQHKILLYADDILLTIEDPGVSVPPLMSLVDSFSRISGYRINRAKSEALLLSSYCPGTCLAGWDFRWSLSGIKYLGIMVHKSPHKMLQLNFDPLFREWEIDVQRWSSLHLSLSGKINAIKMNLAPRVNYLSTMIPLWIPPATFVWFQRLVKRFLWDGKSPKLAEKKLYPCLTRGGLNLPHFFKYFLAFQLKQLAHWYVPQVDAPIWRSIEQEMVGVPLGGVLVSKLPVPLRDHPTISASFWVWREVARILCCHPNAHPLASLWNNSKILVGGRPLLWREWIAAGVLCIKDLFDGEVLCSFGQLRERFALPSKQFWRFLQLRSAVQSLLRKYPEAVHSHSLLGTFQLGFRSGHLASRLYKCLIDPGMEVSLPSQSAWERELECSFSSQDWQVMWN
uniref:Reverse transcriptase domain-containing protein n=1 Tax=Latimeria chalumnae TaxID=7897 RepID=M3XL94_LATCH